MGTAVLRQSVESSVKNSGLDVLAKFLDTTPETLQLIVDGLIQPPGFDIRQGKNQSVTCSHCFFSIEDIITFVSEDICRAKKITHCSGKLTTVTCPFWVSAVLPQSHLLILYINFYVLKMADLSHI